MIRNAVGFLALVMVAMPCPGHSAASRGPDGPARDDFGLYVQGEKRSIPLPLASTRVRGTVHGFVSRVDVTQIFVNPYDDTIEATYVFPLPESAAVHDMVMTVGDREIVAEIRRREDAEKEYDDAVAKGHTASLLTQERPNIFTQKVGNIPPGHAVEVKLSYVEALPYEKGRSTFAFPVVVGPRFIPGRPIDGSRLASAGRLPDTTRVPDASRITPPVLDPDETTAHRIDLQLEVTPGRALRALESPSHHLDIERHDGSRATVRIAPDDRFPDKDFVLHIDVRGENPEATVLSHRDEAGNGYATLVVQPPALVEDHVIAPKDLFFVVDNSGSMHGAPLTAAKELVKTALSDMNPDDRFTIMRFSDAVSALSPTPLPNTDENVEAGVRFIDAMQGMGGTHMLSGVKRALEGEVEEGRVRIVFFLTDGYIGNDHEILAAVEHENQARARLFSLGVGSSVNRYLLRGMARLGRGEMQVMRYDEAPGPFVRRFYDRVRNPVLTDIEIDWGGLSVHDTVPEVIPDLFDGQPLMVHTRYDYGASGTVTVRGRIGSRRFEQRIAVELPERKEMPAIASLWARKTIEGFMDQESRAPGALKEEITQVALDHRLMSKYTAFVAVDREVVSRAPQEPLIPVAQLLPLPDGVSRLALGSLSRRHIPPGDPIISIAAPSDAKRVTAYFPFGLVKELHFDSVRDVWRGRFLVPAGVPDGDYTILVVIELADGSTVTRKEPYRLDSSTEDFVAYFADGESCDQHEVDRVASVSALSMVELSVDAIEPATEVYAHSAELGWNRLALTPIDDQQVLWDGLMTLGPDVSAGTYRVLVVVRDAAGNRLSREVILEVTGGDEVRNAAGGLR